MTFPITDSVGAWVPHGRFVIEPTASGALSGLRFAAKDVFDVAGHPTGAGNPTWLATHPMPTAHSPVVAQLLAAGATLVGKVLTDELAYSLHGDNVHHGTPINSAAPDCVPGGSSSGSAAAVAAHLVDFALGTDTGGSTRVPASYTGLWGLRTTHGLVRAQGVVPLHPSFDTVTWLAHDSATFERVGAELLPANQFEPTRVLIPQDTWALADPVFAEPLQRARDALTALLGTEAIAQRFARDTPLTGAKSTPQLAHTKAGPHMVPGSPSTRPVLVPPLLPDGKPPAWSPITPPRLRATKQRPFESRCATCSVLMPSPYCLRPRAWHRAAMPNPLPWMRFACAPWPSPASPGWLACLR